MYSGEWTRQEQGQQKVAYLRRIGFDDAYYDGGTLVAHMRGHGEAPAFDLRVNELGEILVLIHLPERQWSVDLLWADGEMARLKKDLDYLFVGQLAAPMLLRAAADRVRMVLLSWINRRVIQRKL